MKKVQESSATYEVQEKANLTLSLPVELLRRLKEVAGKRGQSVNAVVREIVERETGAQSDVRRLLALAEEIKPLQRETPYRWNREDAYEERRIGHSD